MDNDIQSLDESSEVSLMEKSKRGIELQDGSKIDSGDIPKAMRAELQKQKLMEAEEKFRKLSRRGKRKLMGDKMKKSNQLKRFFSIKSAKEKYPEKFEHYRIGSKVRNKKGYPAGANLPKTNIEQSKPETDVLK